MLPHNWIRNISRIIPRVVVKQVLLGVALAFAYWGEEDSHLPRPEFLPTERNYTYTRGDTATLYCSVKNLGTKTITWRKATSYNPLTIGTLAFSEDKEFSVHHPSPESPYWNLLVKDVRPEHSGRYECQISTQDKMRRTVYLTVLETYKYNRPDINISGSLHIDRGQTIRLRCNATGAAIPPEAIDWFKDGQTLQTDVRRKLEISKKFSINERTITSQLEIGNARMADSGTYTCRTSDLQVTSVDVNVLNAEKPTDNAKTKREKFQETKQAYDVSSVSAPFPSTAVMLLLVLVTSISSSPAIHR